jgi:succinylglutamate desuccinylase
MHQHRIIGQRSGSQPGPLLIVFAQMHGNEPAGFLALQELFKAIDEEYIKNPNFDFKGTIVGLRGNVRAAAQGKRFLDKDLNRSWTASNVQRVKNSPLDQLDNEDLELLENLQTIEQLIQEHQPQRLVVLDLHTTTAHGGLFVIPSKDEASRELGLYLLAPVLHGFLDGLQGTTLHYFNSQNFSVPTTSVCFEAGQHQADDSVSHSVSAIIRCFTALGGFKPEDIETKHEELLLRNSLGLPREGRLIHRHAIQAGDQFFMRSDKIYQNFDPIQLGEILAYDKNGPITAPYTGYILMPLYQKQGEDGFFIIQDCSSNKESEKNQKISLNLC